jgi:ADP-heptose:LPS heptosyltransferase
MSRRQVDNMVGGLIHGGARAILFFTLAERKRVDYFKSTYGNRILAFDLQDLSGAAALLGGCRALVSCNTDILHLSIYLRVPVVAIFDEDARRWISPRNDRVVVVQAKNVRAVGISQILEALDQARRLQRPPSSTS